MTIVAIDVLPYAIPLVTRLDTARGAVQRRQGCVVRLRGDDGTVGLGDAAPHPHAPGGTLEAMRAELAAAARRLVGVTIDRCDDAIEGARHLGRAAAMGLDVAVHDLVARARGVPLVELLGGARRPIDASALLDGDAVHAARAAAATGYRSAKLKATGPPDEVVATVDAIRRASPDLLLRIDANGAWDVERALAFVRGLAADGIEWVEQPVAAHDVAGMAAVRSVARERRIRIAADESITGVDAVRAIAACEAADVVVIKLVQVGGLGSALAVAREAYAAGLAVVVTSGLETSIGTAAALHLAAALGALGAAGASCSPPLAAGVATTNLLARDVVVQPIASAPSVVLPPGPGLGVALAERALALAGGAGAEPV
jgi:o-succinylbenzoate synthase